MNYTLVVSGQIKTLGTVAKDRADALAQFSQELGYELTENPNGRMTDLMLDEWERGPHWTNPTIAVFRKL